MLQMNELKGGKLQALERKQAITQVVSSLVYNYKNTEQISTFFLHTHMKTCVTYSNKDKSIQCSFSTIHLKAFPLSDILKAEHFNDCQLHL